MWVLLRASVDGDRVLPKDARILYNAPKGWELVEDTAELDGEPVSRRKTIVGSIWNIGDLSQDRELRFALVPASPAAREPQNVMDILPRRFDTRSATLDAADRRELEGVIERWQGREWEEITVARTYGRRADCDGKSRRVRR
ncbi:MAG: hypothetical protein U5O39_15295 [Gammaproteobacteria bacterium]|nr:hypothetical protein [Gammaproteobacteria bacterium]